MENEEKKNKKISLMIAVGLHLAIFILFFFIMAWRQPVPPVPEYGIELNFGLDQAGTGQAQPETSPAPAPAEEEQVEEAPEQQQPAEQIEPQEETAEEAVEESVTQPQPSPATEKQTAEKPVEETEEETKPAADTKPEPVEKTAETPNNKPVDKPANASGNTSQGDDPDEAGDKGDPEGTVDARSLYGSQGGGGGPALDLAGWTWDYIPKPQESSNETGRIVFQIKVDDRGEIMQISTLEKTVSPAVERVYRQAVERLTFSRTAAGSTPPVSTGTITFTIKSR